MFFQSSSILLFILIGALTACATNQTPKVYTHRPMPVNLEREITPLKVEQPCFPMQAIRRNAQGWVQLEFSINDKGQAIDVVSIDDSPPGLFEPCALKSIRKWVFEVPQYHQAENRYQFVFQFTLG